MWTFRFIQNILQDSSHLYTWSSTLTTQAAFRMLAALSIQNHCFSNKNPACKYRGRLFYSKGAFLLLARTLLVSIVAFSVAGHMAQMITSDLLKHYKWTSLTLPGILTLISFPLSGWLADAKYGNQKINRLGLVLLAVSTVLHCLFILIKGALVQYKDAGDDARSVLPFCTIFHISDWSMHVYSHNCTVWLRPNARSFCRKHHQFYCLASVQPLSWLLDQ